MEGNGDGALIEWSGLGEGIGIEIYAWKTIMNNCNFIKYKKLNTKNDWELKSAFCYSCWFGFFFLLTRRSTDEHSDLDLALEFWLPLDKQNLNLWVMDIVFTVLKQNDAWKSLIMSKTLTFSSERKELLVRYRLVCAP